MSFLWQTTSKNAHHYKYISDMSELSKCVGVFCVETLNMFYFIVYIYYLIVQSCGDHHTGTSTSLCVYVSCVIPKWWSMCGRLCVQVVLYRPHVNGVTFDVYCQWQSVWQYIQVICFLMWWKVIIFTHFFLLSLIEYPVLFLFFFLC